jgi:hypothetical protein
MPPGKTPLSDIALQYLSKLGPPPADSIKEDVRQTLNALIDGRTTIEDAKIQLIEVPNGDTLVRLIQDILNVPEDPPPYVAPAVPIANYQRKRTQQWTTAEDMRLIAALHRFGESDWGRAATFVGNGRTRAQCSQRWQRKLDPRISSNSWTASDERQLLELVLQHGVQAWAKISRELGNRSDVQCRFRYWKLVREGRTQPLPTPTVTKVEPPPGNQIAMPPDHQNLPDDGLWDPEPVTSMKWDISFGDAGCHFSDDLSGSF